MLSSSHDNTDNQPAQNNHKCAVRINKILRLYLQAEQLTTSKLNSFGQHRPIPCQCRVTLPLML